MGSLLSNLKLFLTESGHFFLLYKKSLFNPRGFKQAYSLDKIAIFLFFSTIIATVLSFPISSATPAVVPTGDGGWFTLIASEDDRLIFGSNRLKVFQFLDNLVAILYWITCVSFLLKIFGLKSMKDWSFGYVWQFLTIPVTVGIVFFDLIKFTVFYISGLNWLSDTFFLILAVPLWLVSFYYIIMIIKIINTKFKISKILAFFTVIFAEILVFLCFLIIDPIAIYQSATGMNSGAERVEQLIEKSIVLIDDEANFDEAYDLLNQSLKISKGNIYSEIVLATGKSIEIQHIQSLPIQSSNDSLINHKKLELRKSLDTMASDYHDIISFQLFLATIYSKNGFCDRSEIAYRQVFHSEKSLPHEKLYAAIALSFMSKTDNEDDPYIKYLLKYRKDSNKLVSFLRISAATLYNGGVDLFLNDLFDERDLQVSQTMMTPIIDQESLIYYMAIKYSIRPCESESDTQVSGN